MLNGLLQQEHALLIHNLTKINILFAEISYLNKLTTHLVTLLVGKCGLEGEIDHKRVVRSQKYNLEFFQKNSFISNILL